MAPRKKWDDDDGRIIADMSGIERPRLVVPKIRGRGSSAGQDRTTSAEQGSTFPAGQEAYSVQSGVQEQTAKQRPWENDSEFTPGERRMYVLGALKAALLIAFAFIAGLGAAVWLMIQVWT